jgi:hypothetical protein
MPIPIQIPRQKVTDFHFWIPIQMGKDLLKPTLRKMEIVKLIPNGFPTWILIWMVICSR